MSPGKLTAAPATTTSCSSTSRLTDPHRRELPARAPNRDSAESRAPAGDLAQHTVRQRGQIYDEMATRRADDLPPPTARKDL